MARTEGPEPRPATLVGAVAQLYQGDLDFGRHVIERLPGVGDGAGLAVEDLSYGAVAVAQRLEELRPRSLVLVGAAARGREPGTVERRMIPAPELPLSEQRQAVAEAITGYVTVDLVVEVAAALGALPEHTVAIELEPVTTEVSESLSAAAETALDGAVSMVRTEIRSLLPSPVPDPGSREPRGSAA